MSKIIPYKGEYKAIYDHYSGTYGIDAFSK